MNRQAYIVEAYRTAVGKAPRGVFRFKRPDVLQDNGWQIPDVSFKNLFGSSYANRLWRYENFNATIGIDYPF